MLVLRLFSSLTYSSSLPALHIYDALSYAYIGNLTSLLYAEFMESVPYTVPEQNNSAFANQQPRHERLGTVLNVSHCVFYVSLKAAPAAFISSINRG